MRWCGVTSLFWLGKVALFAMGWSVSTEAKHVQRQRNVSTLARKSKCFLSYFEIIVDSNKIFGWENCLFIILSLIQSCLQKAKLRCRHSIIQSHYAWKMFSNYPGIKLEPALGTLEDKLNICHHMFTSSTQLQNRSFHVVERTRTSSKCQKMKYARAKRAKITFFIVKCANLCGFCLPSYSWLLKLPIDQTWFLQINAKQAGVVLMIMLKNKW